MKKLCNLALGLLFTGSLAQAQFISPVFPETVYPTAPMAVVLRTQHTSCYSMTGIGFGSVANNLYIHTWNSAGGPVNGIAWRRTNTAGTTLNLGTAVINGDIRDLEAGFIQVSGTYFVVATYYEQGVGFFYRLYQWNAGGLSLVGGPTLLMACPQYRRISLDVHKLYGVAITWQDNAGRVYVKVADASGGTLVIGNNIEVTNAFNAAIPDVAFSHASNLNVRIVFVDEGSGLIHVMHEDFFTLLSAVLPMPFILDDLNPAAYPPPLISDPFRSNNLQLDSPDHFSDDNWSYIYTDDQQNVFTRLQTWSVSATPFTVNLSNWLGAFRNEFLTLGYRPDGMGIHHGWFTRYTGAPVPGFIALEMNDDGSFVTPPGNFKVVANSTAYSWEPVMSFSKQNDLSNRLFVAYPMAGVGGFGYEMRTKLVPWGAPSFIVAPDNPVVLTATDVGISLYPNPFTETFTVAIKNDSPDATYEAVLTDQQGKVMARPTGNLRRMNEALQDAAQGMPSGIYFLTVKNNGQLHETLRVIKAK